jgi:hypothetical protein
MSLNFIDWYPGNHAFYYILLAQAAKSPRIRKILSINGHNYIHDYKKHRYYRLYSDNYQPGLRTIPSD